MSKTKIEYVDKTWNPVTGCSKISPGCERCYAERMAKRLAGRCGYPKDEPFRVTLHPDRLEEPLHWRKPSRIFVCSMGDLFHDDVPFEYITKVFDVMCSWRWPNKAAERDGDVSLLEDPGHTFMVLTKRPERIEHWLNWISNHWPGDSPLNINLQACGHFGSHIWLGVTAENQEQADKRIPVLLQIPAAVRFVSVEPMLGPVDLREWIGCNCPGDYFDNGGHNIYCPMGKETIRSKPDWIICGGESGPGARPMHPDWARSLRDQCVAAKTRFFFKQWGEYCAPSQMPPETYRAWDIHHGTENCWAEDEPRHWRVGKKAAGRLLDGREWDEYPEASRD